MYNALIMLCTQSGNHLKSCDEKGVCNNCGEDSMPLSNEIDDDRLEAILSGCHRTADCGLDSDHEGDCRTYDQIEIKDLKNKLEQFRQHVFRRCKCSGITECFLAMQDIK